MVKRTSQTRPFLNWRHHCACVTVDVWGKLRKRPYLHGVRLTIEHVQICRSDTNSNATFQCTQTVQEPIGEADTDCVRQYSPDECRHVDRICGAENIAKLSKCFWRGKSYYEGERFAPDSDPCFTCYCDASFDNTTSIMDNVKSCFPRECGLELTHLEQFRRGCSPVYTNDDPCCPSNEWYCRKYKPLAFLDCSCSNMKWVPIFQHS